MSKLSDNKVSAVTSQNYTGVATAGQTVIIPGFNWCTVWTGQALYISGVKQASNSYTVNSIGGGLSSQIILSEALVGGETIDFTALDVSSVPSLQGILDAQCLGSVGECRLDLSGANLLLSRHNGYRLVIDNVTRAIPAAGVTLAPTGVANTTYYIYAYLAGGLILTLEAVETAFAVDPRNGVRIKTGDATRSLVGMARTNASGQWVDSEAQRFVISWYNRVYKIIKFALPSDISTASTSFVPITSDSSLQFLSFGDELVAIVATVFITSTVLMTFPVNIRLNGFDAVGFSMHVPSAGGVCSAGQSGFIAPVLGMHYLQIYCAAWGGTLTWQAGNSNISGMIRG